MKLTDLRGILQYIPQFRERTFIISVDGAIVTNENFPNLLVDIAVLRSLNIRVVLTHGASAQIRKLAAAQGITPSNLDGTGITDQPTLKLALTAATGLTHEILEGLAANDLRAAYTNAVIAHPVGILHGVDHLFTGKVERVDIEVLQHLLDHGIIPVLPPLGVDGEGKTYRLNSDGVALAAAQALQAAKLMFITTHDGITVGGRVIRQMPLSDLESVLAMQRDAIHPDLVSKAIHAVAACRAGVPRVHVINGADEEGLLAEVFTNEGVGTLIYGNEFQQIRRALKKDVRAILNLTKGSVQSEELTKRTRSMIERQLGDYYLFEIDQNPVACVALHGYPDQGVGELACLFVSPTHENQGIGRKLVQFVENRAREMGFRALVTLSTQAFTYFQSKAGFSEGTVEDLPPARRDKYEASGRNSKVLVKKLVSPAPKP
jgi:amino-acid N-acetyltransferase